MKRPALTKKLAFAVLATMTATGAMAGVQYKQGGPSPLKVNSVTLAVKSPATNACPATAKVKAWIHTNKAGPVTYMMIRHGMGAGAPKAILAKKVNGKYLAEISREITIHQPTDLLYRIAARGEGDYSFSNWVPVKASCKIPLGG